MRELTENPIRQFGLLVLALFALLSLWFVLPSKQAVSFANFVASTLLSALLLAGYLHVAGIQSEQLETMEAAYTPVLTVNEFTPTDTHPEGTHSERGDWVNVTLSNVGNEVAKDIQIRCIADCYPSPDDFEIEAVSVPLKRKGVTVQASQSEGGVLAAGDTEKDFYIMVKLQVPESKGGSGEPLPFTNVLSAVPYTVDEIRFGMVVEFTNSAGKRYRVPIRPAREFEVEDHEQFFCEAWEAGTDQKIERLRSVSGDFS